jgi:hypothetical protein
MKIIRRLKESEQKRNASSSRLKNRVEMKKSEGKRESRSKNLKSGRKRRKQDESSNPCVEQGKFSRALQKRDRNIHSQWVSEASSRTASGFVRRFVPPCTGSASASAWFFCFTQVKG